MRNSPLWINAFEVVQKGNAGLCAVMTALNQVRRTRACQLIGILRKLLYIKYITGRDKMLDLVVDIFNS